MARAEPALVRGPRLRAHRPGSGPLCTGREQRGREGDLDALWLRGRAYPWRTDSVGLFVGLGLGASWQHVEGTGTRDSGGFVRPPEPFSCSGSDGPGFALGGGLGLDVEMSPSFAFITGLNAAAHRQTGDVVESCAPGSGSITSLGAQIGFTYRLDLDESDRGRAKRGSRSLAKR